MLASLPAPAIARAYYMGDDMYLFDEFQSGRLRGSRRPRVESLLDVFSNIALDEAEHVATMRACQDPRVVVRSPNGEAAVLTVGAASALARGALERSADALDGAAGGSPGAAAGIAELDLALAQLAVAARAMGEGAAGATDGVRAVLAAILGYSMAAADSLSTDLPDVASDLFDFAPAILRAVEEFFSGLL